jgi:excisionase family DNA binding protein
MTDSSQTAPTVLTVEEAGRLLRISRQSAYQAARTGELPTIRIGRRLLVPRAKLAELLGEPLNGNGSAATEPVADTTQANGAPGHDEG